MLINTIDLFGWINMHVLIIQILHTSDLLQTCYHYIPLLLMKRSHTFHGLLMENVQVLYLCALRSHFATLQDMDYIYFGSAYEK